MTAKISMKLMMALALAFATSCSAIAQAYDPRDPHSPLQLIRTIELANVKGRIDHMALDTAGKRIFIAEYENGTVDDVDLTSGKVVGRIGGLNKPQGVAWLARQNEIAVASGDGLVTFYRTSDRTQTAAINLRSDADNVRIDRRNGQLVVGYGDGGLAVIDPVRHLVIRRILLPAHPEAFELVGGTVFVNVPDAHKIIIADLDGGRVSSTIRTGRLFGNFPMAYDARSRIAVAYRAPSTASVLDARSGQAIFSTPICGDADDLYFRSEKLIVLCGSGSVELVSELPQHATVAVTTRKGARTGLLDAASGHLFVAVPARGAPAAIWELSFR